MSTTGSGRVTLPLNHRQVTVDEHDGINIPHSRDEPLAEHLAKVKDMDVRDDDVLLCVFPKSGTHWAYRNIDMLIRGTATYDVRNLDSTFLEFQPVDKMAELDSPRILVTHLPHNYLPRQVKDNRTKIVHVYRNPRAVLVSYTVMMLGTRLTRVSAETLTDKFFTPQTIYGGWFTYMDRAAQFQEENPDQPVFNISYEEMSQNPLDTVKKLADFLDTKATEEFCADVVAACSFDKQKAIEEKDEGQASMKFFRKGDMNDWKNHMTVAVSERFDKVMKERAHRCPFTAKYIT